MTGFGWCPTVAVAATRVDGRMVPVAEPGYDRPASAAAHVRVLMGTR